MRTYWGIENQVHWLLDIVLDEDGSRIRTDHTQQNLAAMRLIAINVLNEDKTSKHSLKGKRQLAGWDESYLESLVFR